MSPILVFPAEITATASMLPRLTQKNISLLGEEIGDSWRADTTAGVDREVSNVMIVKVLEGWRATLEALEQSDR